MSFREKLIKLVGFGDNLDEGVKKYAKITVFVQTGTLLMVGFMAVCCLLDRCNNKKNRRR